MTDTLPLDEPSFLERVVAELDREIAMRRKHYPDWVASGRLEQGTADHRVETLQAARRWIHGQRAFGVIVKAETQPHGPHTRIEVLTHDGETAVYLLQEEKS